MQTLTKIHHTDFFFSSTYFHLLFLFLFSRFFNLYNNLYNLYLHSFHSYVRIYFATATSESISISGGTADATDSKSVGGNLVWVQIPPDALPKGLHNILWSLFSLQSQHSYDRSTPMKIKTTNVISKNAFCIGILIPHKTHF